MIIPNCCCIRDFKTCRLNCNVTESDYCKSLETAGGSLPCRDVIEIHTHKNYCVHPTANVTNTESTNSLLHHQFQQLISPSIDIDHVQNPNNVLILKHNVLKIFYTFKLDHSAVIVVLYHQLSTD